MDASPLYWRGCLPGVARFDQKILRIQWFRMMHKARFSILVGILLLMMPQLHCNSLSHDISTGSLSGIDVSTNDSPDAPNYYAGSTEYWQTRKFLGRLIYTGPRHTTTLTFSNNGPTASYAYNNRFYLTYVQSNGSPNPGRWCEFFLVVRAKGMRHASGNIQLDFSGMNTVIATEGGALSIPYGAGPEEASTGETGYDSNGAQGTYNGHNGFKFLYPYRHIWVDVILIRTSTRRSLRTGRYESQLMITSAQGLSLLMHATGYYGNPGYQDPPSFHFMLEKTIEEDFPFSMLEARFSPGSSLPVGRCIYHSEGFPAAIRFSADNAGTSGTYLLRNDAGEFFPYLLAFDATNPDRSPSAADVSTSFPTELRTVYSPLDSSTRQRNVLEGTVNMYLPTGTYPGTGRYTSTIYCFVTHTD